MLLKHCPGPLRYIRLYMDCPGLRSILGFSYQDGNEKSYRMLKLEISGNIYIKATGKVTPDVCRTQHRT